MQAGKIPLTDADVFGSVGGLEVIRDCGDLTPEAQ